MALDVKKILTGADDSPNWIRAAQIKLINFRIAQEELSSRIYRGMSVWLNLHGYSGAAKLWKKYSDEEQSHADRFYEYLLNLNVLPEVPALPRVENTFSSIMDVAQKSLQHELLVTEQINTLAMDAFKANDHMTYTLAGKYLLEQEEELNKVQTWVDRLKIAGDNPAAILFIDSEMGSKT